MRFPRWSSSPSDRTSRLPCRPAPQTRVCAFSSSPDLSVDPRRRDGRDHRAGHHLDRALGQRLRRVLAQPRLEHREQLRPGLDQDHARLLLRERRIVAREHRPVELGDRPGGLHPGRSPADDDDVERAVVHQARVVVGGLPPLEQVILQATRVRQRVHRKRVLGRAVGPEEVDLGAEAEDEEVVGHRRELVEADLARVEVDADHRRLVDGRVVLPLEQVAKGVSDGRRLEQAGREPGTAVAGRCGSRAGRRARPRRPRVRSFWAAPTPANPPPRMRTRGCSLMSFPPVVPQSTAIGLTGEPVPPSIRSGAATKRNSQRPASRQRGRRSSNCR